MSIDSLPYMVLLLAVEFAVGTQLATYALHLRGLVTRGFLKLGAATALAGAALALWVALSLSNSADAGGYAIDTRFITPARGSLVAMTVTLAIYTWLVWRERRAERFAGAVGSVVALTGLAMTAGIFRLPAWGYPGVLLSLLLGGLSLGTVTVGMVLGHWYLVSPRLPEQPLNETTLGLLAVVAVQTVVVVINLALPVHQSPSPDIGGALAQNPAFWLRLGVGLVFPIILAAMAWRSSVERGMMSATGLLYVATGAVLAGEALARGLQLATAIPF